ncbi:MAG: LysR family transcriptional regulator [Gammaproteobacteria bacterium]|nr:MAG: LysR family transcriptional regulator [Gammaproteobacteria bacterium]
MDQLKSMDAFVRLAELGSFTRVAEQRNTSKSQISKEISALEDHLKVRLVHRTTRNLRLTPEGETYLTDCREILEKIQYADLSLLEQQSEPSGKLKINAPMALGITHLGTLFADFMSAYPGIELDVHLGDESVDLVEQGFDLGFRVSSRPIDSAYIGRPLREFSYHVCAAPNYIAQHTAITEPTDLQDHNCFIYSYFQGKAEWPIDAGIPVSGTLKVNSTLFLMQVIKQGLGIGLIPEFVCQEAIDQGTVVSLLDHHPKPTLTLYALYPARNFVPPKLKLCIAFLETWFKENY